MSRKATIEVTDGQSPRRSATLEELQNFVRRQAELNEILAGERQRETGARKYVKEKIGHELPTICDTLEDTDVLTEPMFWPLYFAYSRTRLEDLDRASGIDGEVACVFESLLKLHYGERSGLALSEYQILKITSVKKIFKNIGRAAIRFPLDALDSAAPTFFREIGDSIYEAREAIKLLDRDMIKRKHGRAAADKYMNVMCLEADRFNRRSRAALREAVKASRGPEQRMPEKWHRTEQGRGRGGGARGRRGGRGAPTKDTADEDE